MNGKISTIDEGLRYLNHAKKECRADLYGRIKMDLFRFLLGHTAGAAMLFLGKSKNNGNTCKCKNNIAADKEMPGPIPLRTLACVAGVSCVIGIVSWKMLSRKRNT